MKARHAYLLITEHISWRYFDVLLAFFINSEAYIKHDVPKTILEIRTL